MRNFLIGIILQFFSILVVAQNGTIQLPLKDSLIVYEEVIYLKDSLYPKEKIYLRAKTWLTNTFNDVKQVIQMEDKDEGRLIGKGLVTIVPAVLNSPATYGNFTLQLDVKEGKIRYKFFDTYFESPASRAEPSYKVSASKLYLAYLKEEAPRELRYTLEGKKGFLSRVEKDLLTFDKNIRELISTLKLHIQSGNKKEEDW